MYPSNSSGQLAASAVVTALPGRLTGLMIEGDGTNAASVIIYDNATAASGTILAKVLLKASSGDLSQPVVIPVAGVQANNGLYCAISGTGCKAIVHFTIGN